MKEKKILAMQYDAFTDCDGLMAVTPEEFQELKDTKFNNAYSGWIAVIADYTSGTGKAWEVLQAVNERFRNQEAYEQVVDVLNDLPEVELKLPDITPEFIAYMEKSGHELTYRLPDESYPLAYFVITSRAYLQDENERMFAAEAAMM